MSIKVIEIELSEGISPIQLEEYHTGCWALIRFNGQTVDKIYLAKSGSNTVLITSEVVQSAIADQIGLATLQNITKQSFKRGKEIQANITPISVIICTRNRTEALKNCLEQILLQDYPQYEIIVVDNAPSDDSTANLVKQYPVRYVKEPQMGISWARNRGVREAQYPIIAFTDDDVKVDKYWLIAIALSFSQDDVMVVTGNVAPAELDTQAQRIFELRYGGMGHGFKDRLIQRKSLSKQQLLWASSFGVTANAAIRREVFQKVGLFDIAFFPNGGGEDIEFFHRVVAKGHTLFYNPSVLVWHSHRKTLDGLYQQVQNNCRNFGFYLLTCYDNRTVGLKSIFHFYIYHWLFQWILKRLFHPKLAVPRRLVLSELKGALTAPFNYHKVKKWRKTHAATIQ